MPYETAIGFPFSAKKTLISQGGTSHDQLLRYWPFGSRATWRANKKNWEGQKSQRLGSNLTSPLFKLHGNGKSQFLIGDTSSHACFSIVILVFGGKIDRMNSYVNGLPRNIILFEDPSRFLFMFWLFQGVNPLVSIWASSRNLTRASPTSNDFFSGGNHRLRTALWRFWGSYPPKN